jgi:predicted small lipoprotein YifL
MKVIAIGLLLTAFMALSACGKKGDLLPPEDYKAPAKTTSNSTI